MWYNNLYCIIFVSIIAIGILAIMPSAFANIAQVIIIPGAGSSKYCSETTTCFTPSILNISPSDTVTWTNNDNVDHIIVSGLPYANQTGTIFDSGTIAPGKTFSFTFQDAGTYTYSDKIDKWMVGKVIVKSTQPSHTVPEFSTITSLIVLVSITGVIAITRTFMKN